MATPVSTLLTRRASYIGVRNFFYSAIRANAQTGQPRRASPSQSPGSSNPVKKYTKKTNFPRRSASVAASTAEGEWLQENEPQSAIKDAIILDAVEPGTLSRFDWRTRAYSRLHKPQTADTFRRDKPPKRIFPANERVKPGEPYHEAIVEYEKKFLPLLQAEQAEEQAVLQERLSTWSEKKLQEEGYALTGLSAYWLAANRFGRPVACFSLGPGMALPDTKFENGSQLLISRLDPTKEEPYRGSVVSKTSSQIKVAFGLQFEELAEGEWRIDLGLSDIIHERMRNAINALHQDPTRVEDVTPAPGLQHILQGSHLRDVLLRTFDLPSDSQPHPPLQAADEVSYPPHDTLEHDVANTEKLHGHPGAFKDDMRIQSWAKRYMEIDPVVVEGDPILPDLNVSQRRAMAMMIGQSLSLVQGPPGTGKTKTIIETVRLLKAHFEVPHPVLVCTYTNVAVDNLVEGLIATGLNPLRIAFGTSVRESLKDHSLEHKLLLHPLQPQLQAIIKEEEALQGRLDALRIKVIEVTQKALAGTRGAAKRLEKMKVALAMMGREHGVLRGKKYGIQQEMLRDVVREADVICTTCITSACTALNVTDFPVVFLDEASMSTEPASLIPLMKGSRHVALIGDHKQLPPVITSAEAQNNGLGVSLFERLTEEGEVPSMMLDVQYRMHPAISDFPSMEFYDSTLMNGTIDAVGNIEPSLLPPSSKHLQVREGESGHRPSVIFLDHSGNESLKDRSRVNHHEAHIVASVVEDLLLTNPDLQGRDIGIIAPYVAQISLLSRLFTRDATYRARFKEVLGDHRAMQIEQIEIKTVDGFEGREKEVIIFSTVRNNPGGYIGFLADRRRLNVGLTRAKRGLFVVGNINTLKAGKMSRGSGGQAAADRVGRGAESWRRYVKYLAQHGLVLKLEGELLSQALYGHVKSAKAAKHFN